MLQLNHVTLSFPGLFQPVLKDIHFSLQAEEYCIVIGANGSGKSTLMKLISGDYTPNSGHVHCSAPVAQVVQDVNKGTISSMTLLENMALSLMRHKKHELAFYHRYLDDIREKIKATGMGLEKYLDQPVGNLSGGQRQIIATLMAMHSGAQILLLDEHTSALDPKMQVMLMEYTARAITQSRLTTMMITHKMEDAVNYGNRLIVLHQGRIVLDISGPEKARLSKQELLALFHHYEDQTLLSEPVL